MSRYQHLTITSYPSSRATICKAPIISGSGDCMAGNSWKYSLSSNIEDDQFMTLCCQKQFPALKLDGLNSESDDNQPTILRYWKQPILSESNDDKPYIVCLNLLSFLMKQAVLLQSPVYDVL